MDVARFRKKPIMGILRSIELDVVEPLVETVLDSGLETIEITMNTKDAPKLIKQAVKIAKKRLMIGAGTVLNNDDLTQALDAGATFIVTPVLVAAVMEYCVKKCTPVFPGAFSPQEIYSAWKAGATMVKVFPAKFMGPEYFKEIKGPFNDVELLACAGVTAENLKSYFLNGADAVSFGASVFKKEWLEREDFESIGKCIKKFMDEFSAYSAKKGN